MHKVERRGPYQGVPQYGITGCAEITPSRATAVKWAALANAERKPMRVATFEVKAEAEKLVAFLRRKLNGFGFEVGMLGAKWGVRVFNAEGRFMTWAAPVGIS